MKELNSKNYYELLGVDRKATKEEIKSAYREIARVYHPDSNFFDEIVGDKPGAGESDIFKIITSAYNTLVNDDKRAEYDRLLPRGLKEWDSRSWEGETVEVDEMGNPKKPKSAPFAWGTFGTGERPKSAFDAPTEAQTRRAVSTATDQPGLFKRLFGTQKKNQ